jgi:hypothetical protein
MRYYQPHAGARFYAGVDLHARSLYLAVGPWGRGPCLPSIARLGRRGVPRHRRRDPGEEASRRTPVPAAVERFFS